MNTLKSGTRVGQSVRDQLGEGEGGGENGCESIIWTGTWSEPVGGRGVSHVWQNGSNEGEAKETSGTGGRLELLRGKGV